DYGFSNLCSTYVSLGEYRSAVRSDPTETLHKALAACDKSIAVDPEWAGTHINAACAHFDLAMWQFITNADPRAELARSKAASARSLAVDHKYEYGFRYQGEVALLTARWTIAHGGSPGSDFESSRRWFARALEQNPKNPDTLREMAESWRFQAE